MATKAPKHNASVPNGVGRPPQQPAAPQPESKKAWGWTSSLNSFVSAQVSAAQKDIQKAGTSLFDNVSATLAKKGQLLTSSTSTSLLPGTTTTTRPPPSNPSVPQPDDFRQHRADSPIAPHASSRPLPRRTASTPHIQPNGKSSFISNGAVSEEAEWRRKYAELKKQHTLKVAMLEDQLQQYKASAASIDNEPQSPSSPRTASKVDELERRIAEHKQRETQCIELLQSHMAQSMANSDALRLRIEGKYQLFFDQLLSVTLRAGLDPVDIFKVDGDDHERMRLRVEAMRTDLGRDTDLVDAVSEPGTSDPGTSDPGTSPTRNAEECIERNGIECAADDDSERNTLGKCIDNDSHHDTAHDADDCKIEHDDSGHGDARG